MQAAYDIPTQVFTIQNKETSKNMIPTTNDLSRHPIIMRFA